MARLLGRSRAHPAGRSFDADGLHGPCYHDRNSARSALSRRRSAKPSVRPVGLFTTVRKSVLLARARWEHGSAVTDGGLRGMEGGYREYGEEGDLAKDPGSGLVTGERSPRVSQRWDVCEETRQRRHQSATYSLRSAQKFLQTPPVRWPRKTSHSPPGPWCEDQTWGAGNETGDPEGRLR